MADSGILFPLILGVTMQQIVIGNTYMINVLHAGSPTLKVIYRVDLLFGKDFPTK